MKHEAKCPKCGNTVIRNKGVHRPLYWYCGWQYGYEVPTATPIKPSCAVRKLVDPTVHLWFTP